jgi:hypothetical protein
MGTQVQSQRGHEAGIAAMSVQGMLDAARIESRGMFRAADHRENREDQREHRRTIEVGFVLASPQAWANHRCFGRKVPLGAYPPSEALEMIDVLVLTDLRTFMSGQRPDTELVHFVEQSRGVEIVAVYMAAGGHVIRFIDVPTKKVEKI